MKKIKYGIIGAGTMAREHILNISLIDNAEVVALADPNEDSLNQCKEILKTEVSCFKNHLEMIEKNKIWNNWSWHNGSRTYFKYIFN